MTANSIIKKQTRGYLQGSWAALAAAFLVIFVPLSLASAIETVMIFFGLNGLSVTELLQKADKDMTLTIAYASVAAVILLVFIFSLPLLSGFFRMSAAVANGETAQCSDLFYFFEKGKYADALGFNMSLAVRCLLWTVLSFLPAAACVVVQKMGILGSLSWMTTILGVLMMTLGVVLSVVLNSRYFLAQYLFVTADGQGEQAKNAIRISVKLMRGNRKKYLSLLVSFLPWIALTFFVLPALYTVPYMMVSFANSAKWICGNAAEWRVESEE